MTAFHSFHIPEFLRQKPSSLSPLHALPEPLSVKQLIQGIKNHDFQSIYFKNYQVITTTEDKEQSYVTNISPLITDKLVDLSLTYNMDPEFAPTIVSQPPDFLGWSFNVLVFSIIVQSIVSFYRNTMKGNRGGSNNSQFMNMPFSNREPGNIKNNNVTLQDWAGSPEVLEECTEIVTYLNHPDNYLRAGATIPKGILMDGPPGTGKTLLAKAIATEAKAHFIEMSGSEFIEMYVGLGALRVRNLFADARKNTPCVIFIDEIDAIGKKRNGADSPVSGGNDEKDQTLNQLLAEMDGFKSNSGILILAATNRKDVLDPALLRPGRFDRIVSIPLPDLRSRVQIFDLYLKNRNVSMEINSQELAKMSGGFSGADIQNIMNEAAVWIARKNETVITQPAIMEAFEKRIIGIKKKVDDRSPEVKRRVAIHELGHAFMVTQFYEHFDLHKVSIQASYSGVGGFTLFNEKDHIREGGLYTKEILKQRIMIALGGKAAEEVFYGEENISVGATMDLNQANALATDMIEKYGMGTELNVFYKSNSPSLYSTYSEYTRKMIDQEVAILVKDAYKSALIRLQEKKEYIHHIADRLMYSIVMSHEELVNFRVEPKPKMISSWEHEWRIRNGLRVPSPEPPSSSNLRLTSLDGTSSLTSCNEVGSLSLNKAYDITGNISHLDDENESIPCDCELP
jgi:cell division protease FtsH